MIHFLESAKQIHLPDICASWIHLHAFPISSSYRKVQIASFPSIQRTSCADNTYDSVVFCVMLCRCLSSIWTQRAKIQKLWNRRREKMKWLKLKLLRVGSGLFKANTTLFWKRHAVTKFFKCNFPSLEWHGVSLRHSNGFVAGTSGKKYSHICTYIHISVQECG